MQPQNPQRRADNAEKGDDAKSATAEIAKKVTAKGGKRGLRRE